MWRLRSLMHVGIGFRREMAGWIESGEHGVDCLEITAEHFIGDTERHIAQLAQRLPLYVHGLGLSLGTPGPLDARRVEAFARVVELANPRWVSEHVAFTRTAEVDLGHLNPVPLTRDAIKTSADRRSRSQSSGNRCWWRIHSAPETSSS